MHSSYSTKESTKVTNQDIQFELTKQFPVFNFMSNDYINRIGTQPSDTNSMSSNKFFYSMRQKMLQSSNPDFDN